jgi:hypothetical protein
VLVLGEHRPNRGPPALHGREHIFDVRAAYPEHVLDAGSDELLDQQIRRVSDSHLTAHGLV